MALADDKAKQRHEGSFATEVAKILRSLGVSNSDSSGGSLAVRSPIDGSQLAAVREASDEEATAAVGRAEEAFLAWRDVPAPRRGELVRPGATMGLRRPAPPKGQAAAVPDCPRDTPAGHARTSGTPVAECGKR